MNNLKKLFRQITIAVICTVSIILTSCGKTDVTVPSGTATEVSSIESSSEVVEETAEYTDVAGNLKLDMSTDTIKTEVTVKSFVDGDTTHFNVPTSISEDGVLKARYLGVNTPESTGKIEEYGKTASNFTKETLSKATSIIVETDGTTWDVDSTGGRYLLWVWYRTSDDEDYRNLNVELLQNGLAIASNSANNRYGEYCTSAISNAKACKLNIHSGEKDPNFFYGDALELSAKEIRTNLEEYTGSQVAFEGVVTKNYNNGVYVEEYDPETEQYYGMYVYYGFNLAGEGLDVLTVGNRVRIVGSLQFYANGGTYQVSGLTYRQMKPDDPGNIKKLGEGFTPAYALVSADDFVNKKVTLLVGQDEKEFSFAETLMDTSVSIENLDVVDIYTTSNPDSSSNGAMTITCKDDKDNTIDVRTTVLTDEAGNLVTADAFTGKNISVKGIVDYYNGNYQIKVLSVSDITINN